MAAVTIQAVHKELPELFKTLLEGDAAVEIYQQAANGEITPQEAVHQVWTTVLSLPLEAKYKKLFPEGPGFQIPILATKEEQGVKEMFFPAQGDQVLLVVGYCDRRGDSCQCRQHTETCLSTILCDAIRNDVKEQDGLMLAK